MEAYQGIMLVIVLIGFVASWFIKPNKDQLEVAFKKIDDLRKELSDYKLHVAETYVTDTALERHFERIESQIAEIKEIIKR